MSSVSKKSSEKLEIHTVGAAVLQKLATSSSSAPPGTVINSSGADLLSSLNASGCREEAIQLLVSLDPLGTKHFDAMSGEIIGECSLHKKASEHAMAVLIAVVNAVTAEVSAQSQQTTFEGGDSVAGGGAGGRGDSRRRHHIQLFEPRESEALASICEEALRALVR